MYGSFGEVVQPGAYLDPSDDRRIYAPCMGVIWRVSYSDDADNMTAAMTATGRGNTAMAEVIIVDDGTKKVWTVYNAILPAPGPTGWADYAEWLPKGCSMAIDGTEFRDVGIADYSYLDGTWCIVGFIGGQVTMPVVLGYVNHPRNDYDPATSGQGNDGEALEQEGRIAVRWNGSKLVVTGDGSFYLDTSGAAAEVTGGAGQVPVLTPTDEGGALNIAIKPTAAMDVTFNVPPESRPLEPDLFQPNPPDPAVLAKAEAQAAAARLEAAARQQVLAAKNAAKAALLQSAAAALPVAQAAYTAAQAALATAQSVSIAGLAASYEAQLAAKIVEYTALAAVVPPVPGAAEELAKLIQKAATLAATVAADAALEQAEAAEAVAAEALRLAQAAAAQALRATQAAQNGETDEDRLLPDGTFIPARTRVHFDGDDALVLAGTAARFMARGGDDSVEIGGTPDDAPTHHAVLAEPVQATWDANAEVLNDVIDSLNEARIELGLPPLIVAVRKFPVDGRSRVVKVK